MPPLEDNPLDLTPMERRLILMLRALSRSEQILLVATVDAVLDGEAPDVIVTGFEDTLAALRAVSPEP